MRPINTPEKLLSDFTGYLRLERGLSGHTLQGYATDVRHLMEFLEGEGSDVTIADTDTLHSFLCTLHDLGISPRSQARIISGIRSFFKFLRIEKYIDTDPCELLEAPRFGRTVPDVLSVEDIDNMIAALDPEKDETPRNHAIIETLYGSGLRVSELVDLRLSRINLEEGYMSRIRIPRRSTQHRAADRISR